MSDLNDKDFEDLKFDLQLFADGDGDGDGGDDGFPYPYMAQFPDEMKGDEFFRPYKSLGEVGKGFKGTRAMLDKVPKPPDKADGYEFNKPEDINVNPETEKWFRKTAFGLKIPKETAGKLYDEFNKMVAAQVKGQTKKNETEATKNDELMHGEWDTEYENNMKLADKGVADIGGEDLQKLLEKVGIAKHPVILKAFKQVGFEHGDDNIKEGVVTGSSKEWTLDDEYESMKDLPPDKK